MTTPFTSERAEGVLAAACRIAELDSRGASLLRFGENAIFLLPRERKVARIGRSLVAAAKEVHVANWLDEYDFPAMKVATGFSDGPLVVDDLPVTFWQYIDDSSKPITSAEFGRLLRSLHSLPDPTNFRLPRFQPMPKVLQRLERLSDTDIPPDDLSFLHEKHKEVSARFETLDYLLPPGPIHGDAYPGNLMRATDGLILLIDFEDFSYGPREWDAAVLSVRHQAFGWESEEDYRSYVEAYGFDPIDWSGFSTLRSARELNITTWLAQNYGESDRLNTEVRKRIADLRNDQSLRHWTVF